MGLLGVETAEVSRHRFRPVCVWGAPPQPNPPLPPYYQSSPPSEHNYSGSPPASSKGRSGSLTRRSHSTKRGGGGTVGEHGEHGDDTEAERDEARTAKAFARLGAAIAKWERDHSNLRFRDFALTFDSSRQVTIPWAAFHALAVLTA